MNSSIHFEAGPESCSVSPGLALPLGLWDQTVGRVRDCRWDSIVSENCNLVAFSSKINDCTRVI